MRPTHYGGEENPHEAIKIIEHYNLGFHLGNCIKYMLRAGKKDNELEDLEKAKWYLDKARELKVKLDAYGVIEPITEVLYK